MLHGSQGGFVAVFLKSLCEATTNSHSSSITDSLKHAVRSSLLLSRLVES